MFQFPPTQLLIILIIFSFKANPIIHVMFEVSFGVFEVTDCFLVIDTVAGKADVSTDLCIRVFCK